jgi:sporulation protein YlmC with PRC-barrel domain
MSNTYLRYCAGLLLASLASTAAADWERASDLLGRSVETRDGEPLGRVHDFALDVDGGRIHFVVISVGSFLIDDSFIAVEPAALRDSADPDRMLVLERNADELRSVPRFADTDWPDSADVVAATEAPADAENPAAEAGGRGTATISSERKRATLAGGERRIEVTEPEPAPTAPDETGKTSGTGEQAGTAPGVPDGPFARLDANGDGVLDRSEIAHEMRRGDRYAEIDTDADGTIDPEEFAALLARRESDE